MCQVHAVWCEYLLLEYYADAQAEQLQQWSRKCNDRGKLMHFIFAAHLGRWMGHCLWVVCNQPTQSGHPFVVGAVSTDESRDVNRHVIFMASQYNLVSGWGLEKDHPVGPCGSGEDGPPAGKCGLGRITQWPYVTREWPPSRPVWFGTGWTTSGPVWLRKDLPVALCDSRKTTQ